MKIRRRELLTGMSAAVGVAAAASVSPMAVAAAPEASRQTRPSPAQNVFSDDYQTARSRFVAAATAAGAHLEHYRLPGFDGPDGKPLFMDAARLGPSDADVVVVSVSGTHGAEGYPGSAAQIDWLLNEAPRRNLPAGVAAVLVHAVNPYGFAYMLRTNENGVNLNRNAIDFSAPLPPNPLFEEIFASFPDRLGHDEELVAEFDAVRTDAERKYGRWEVSDALGRGQFVTPAGPEYGGKSAQWSSVKLYEILQNMCRGARHVAYLDWHSLMSLGDGKLLYLCFNQTGDALFERAGSWWGREAIDREAVNRQWGAATTNRRPSRHGILMWGVQHALAPQADVAGAVIEFCTDADRFIHSPEPSARGWVYTRWLQRTRDYTSPTGRFIESYLREGASPTRASFQDSALAAARTSYAQAFAGARDWARENVPARPGKLVHYSAFE